MNETVALDPLGSDYRWWDDPTDSGPDDSEPFDGDSAPGYADSDYSGTPQSWMREWVPKSVAEQLGEIRTTTLNGDYLYFQASCRGQCTETARLRARTE
jgi:hypothetical protein